MNPFMFFKCIYIYVSMYVLNMMYTHHVVKVLERCRTPVIDLQRYSTPVATFEMSNT